MYLQRAHAASSRIKIVFFSLLVVIPVAKADSWDDFFNNLSSDLAPLLALFGEQVTKQYISESLTLLDNFIFAMAPLGILTAVVSAIRVCGNSSLRAFIGRAQEGRASVETELLSSTSHNVCELWNDGGIARVFGNPKILELVHDEGDDKYDTMYYGRASSSTVPARKPTAGIYLFREAIKDHQFRWREEGPEKSTDADDRDDLDKQPGTRHDTESGTSFAPNPNLSLNIGIKRRPLHVFVMAAILGCALQTGILVYGAIITYKYPDNFKKNGQLVKKWTYPLMFIGTVLLCLGMFLCAYLVERSTSERVFDLREGGPGVLTKEPPDPKIYWLQPGGQTVGDQTFDAFGWEETPERYITSWKPDTIEGRNITETKSIRLWTAVFLTMVGFILQFVGFRGMHSSVALSQLISIAIMAIVRASLRMKRSDENLLRGQRDNVQGHELDWLAMRLEKCHTWGIIGPEKILGSELHLYSGDSVNFSFKRSGRKPFLVIGGISESNPNPKHPSLRIDSLQGRTENDVQDWEIVKYFPGVGGMVAGREKGEDSPVVKPNLAVRVLKNRARLGRLTGLEDGNQIWDFQTRRQAQTLQKAIEAVVDALYVGGFKFKDGWETARTIVWGINCNAGQTQTWQHKHDPPSEDLPLYLSLRRMQDAENNTPTSWKADASEIEAVLSLWLWSLRSHKPVSTNITNRRIIAQIHPADRVELMMDYKIWIQRDTSSFVEPLDPSNTSVRLRGNQTSRYFGWQVIENSNNSVINVITALAPKDLGAMCSQEIFASLMSAMSNIIEEVQGQTTRRSNDRSLRILRHGTAPEEEFMLLNTELDKVARAFSDTGLGTIEDAYMCIVPLLRLHSKLPITKEAYDNARISAFVLAEQNRLCRAAELLRWIFTNCSTFLPDGVGRVKTEFKALFDPQVVHKDDSETTKSVVNNSILWLLDRTNIEPGLKDSHNKTPLLWAAQNRKVEVLQKLLDHGFDPNVKSPGGTSALHLAVKAGSEAMVRLLLDNKADPNLKDAQMDTPLTRAAALGREAIVRLLLERGAKIQLKDLAKVASLPPEGKPKPNEPRTIKNKTRDVLANLLIEKGAPVDIGSIPGGTSAADAPLHAAATSGDLGLVKNLLNKGAGVNSRSDKNETPLHKGAGMGHIPVVTFLLQKGADIHAADSDGITPIFIAARAGHLEVVELLLKNGARVDGNEQTYTPLVGATDRGQTAVIELLLRHGANPENGDREGLTPLARSARGGLEANVRLLMDNGAQLNARDREGKTPLCWACAIGHEPVVRLLLEAGADIKNIDGEGRTPLLWTCYMSMLTSIDDSTPQAVADRTVVPEDVHYKAVIQLLLDHGADLNERDPAQQTPLITAVGEKGDIEVLRLLLESGADPDAQDAEGRTAYSLAYDIGYEGIPELIMTYVKAKAASQPAPPPPKHRWKRGRNASSSRSGLRNAFGKKTVRK